MDNPGKVMVDAFLREMGRLVLSWNMVERHMISLLRRTVVDSQAIDILTAHMTAEAKIQVLRACSSQMPEGDIKDRLLHACKYADILREWRNHCVHNTGQAFGVGKDVVNFTYQVKARHNFIIKTGTVTPYDLERVQQGCDTLTDFTYRLDTFIEWEGKDSSHVRLQDGSMVSLPGMPPLPLSLEEHRKSQQQPPPQP